jgi:Xaa-Pro aminopeptidase
MQRRTFLKASAAGGLATSIPATELAKSAVAPMPVNPGIDRARARFVLKQAGLDAIVLGRPENIFYATGNWPLLPRLGISDQSFAIIPADERAPITYVSPQFGFYYAAADSGLAAGVVPHLVTGPDGEKAAEAFFFADIPGVPITAREKQRRTKTRMAAPFFVESAAAVAQALAKAGISGGRLGYDSLEAKLMLNAGASAAQCVGAVDTIKRLRVIKTALEIELMKTASRANVMAANQAATAMRGLGTIKNLRNHFNSAASRLGNKPGFMVINGAVDEAYDEEFVEGTSVLIDCVSTFQGYHGDYGRTIFLGEPRSIMAVKVQVISSAWNELRDALKPGLRFSEVRDAGAAIVKKMGHQLNVPFNPHCVGLAHTEQPQLDSKGAPVDTVLEPGMIISVDCPLMESSEFGTAHLEDLTLITSDGHAPIHDIGNNCMIV